MNEQQTEVIYTKAKLGRRVLAHIIDVGIFLFTTIVLFTVFHVSMRESSFYKEKYRALNVLRNDSGLYINDIVITEYVENDKIYPTYTEKKDELSHRIDNFYINQTYFKDNTKPLEAYQNRQLNATYKGTNLFVKDSDDHIVENSLASEIYYNFYSKEIDNHALSYLTANPTFRSLVRFSFYSTIVEASIAAFISYIVFYYVFPSTFWKLGRQTIGMKLEKIGLISIRADNVTFGVFTLRTLFNFVVFVILNLAGFLIPTFVSFTMMFVNKTNSSFTNYVFNDYMVDISDQDIYFNEFERQYALKHIHEASIENQDFKLK